jgi:hypothetical protein
MILLALFSYWFVRSELFYMNNVFFKLLKETIQHFITDVSKSINIDIGLSIKEQVSHKLIVNCLWQIRLKYSRFIFLKLFSHNFNVFKTDLQYLFCNILFEPPHCPCFWNYFGPWFYIFFIRKFIFSQYLNLFNI